MARADARLQHPPNTLIALVRDVRAELLARKSAQGSIPSSRAHAPEHMVDLRVSSDPSPARRGACMGFSRVLGTIKDRYLLHTTVAPWYELEQRMRAAFL